MNRTLSRLLGRALLAGLIALPACGMDAGPERPAPELRLSPEAGTVTVGDTLRLVIVVFGPAGPDTVAWTTSDPLVATVNAGLVRGVGPGLATIVASVGGARDSVAVTVILPQPQVVDTAGQVVFGFEAAGFGACGEPRWWSVAGPESGTLYRRWNDVRAAGALEVWARARIRLSPPGQYGHLGAYPRQAEILEVKEVRPARATDCPSRPVSVRPHRTQLAAGDTLLIDFAVYDDAGRTDLVPTFRSSDTAVATVDARGRVALRRQGHVVVHAAAAGGSDSTIVDVSAPEFSNGYAFIEGQFLYPAGQPAVGLGASALCFMGTGPVATDMEGRFHILVLSSDFGSAPFSSAHRLLCALDAGTVMRTWLAVPFALPGHAPDTTRVQLVVRPHTILALGPAPAAVYVGDTVRVTVTDPVERQPRFLTVLPEVASVDATGLVRALAPGETAILALGTSDTTAQGALRLTVVRR